MSVFGVVVGVVVGTLIGIALSYAVPDSFIDGITIPWVVLIIVVVLAVRGGRRRRPLPGVQGVAHERARGDRHRVTRHGDRRLLGHPAAPRSWGSSRARCSPPLHAPDDFGDTLGELPPEARAG